MGVLIGLHQFISRYGLLAIGLVQLISRHRTLSGIKLFHMDLSDAPERFTFADALNLRYWRIYHALPMRLLTQMCNIYASKSTCMKLKAKGNTLNLTLTNLCSNLFGRISLQR